MKKEELKNYIRSCIDKIFNVYNSFNNSLIIMGERTNLNSVEIKEVSLENNVSFYFSYFNAIAEYRERLKNNIERVDFLEDSSF